MLRRFFARLWDSFREYLYPDHQRDLLEILCQEYIEKSENVLKLTNYAATMVYPQFRDKLLRIANEEQDYIPRLADHITALGGKVPDASFSPRPGKNAWERLLNALEKKQRQGSDRIDRLVRLERIDPKIGEELRRMLQQEEIHQREIQAMMMRSDPQAALNSVS